MTKTTIVAALGLVAAMAAPMAASAQTSYHDGAYAQPSAAERCRTDEQRRKLIGSGIGGVAGAFIGDRIGDTTGAVVGAAIGGSAGYGIGDKTIDCDPVYVEQPQPYSGSYPQSYGTVAPAASHPNPSYTPTGQPYYSQTASSGYSTSSTQYGDRVWVSDHPVYSDPAYGARTVQTYAPSQPAPTQPRYVSTQPTYTQAQPTYAQPSYTRTHTPQSGYVQAGQLSYGATHYHGRHACTGIH